MKVASARYDKYFYEDGSSKVDMMSGCYHLHLGHCSDEEIRALTYSIGTVHNSYKEDDGTAAKLGALLNLELHQKRDWHFLTTGSEAVERAVMCAMQTGAQQLGRAGAGTLVIMEGAFHGKTFFSSKAYYKTPWAWPFHVHVIPWMEFHKLPEKFDALLFEPVQGSNGRAATHEQMEEIRSRCDRAGAMMIADEILCGLGRCGYPLYSAMAYPDIVTVGKGMAGSLPISAVGISSNLPNERKMPAVGWYATHAGYSLANRVALQLLPIILKEAKRKARQIEELFTDSGFPGRYTGALLFARVGENTPSVVYDLKEKGFIVADHKPYIKMAPCYKMGVETMNELIGELWRSA